MRDSRCSVLLFVGRWLLVVRCWLCVARCALPVVVCYLLVVVYRRSSFVVGWLIGVVFD